MQKVIVALGSILAIIGVVLAIATVVPIQHSYIWLNESFVIPESGYYTYSGTFPRPITLHITFSVTYGGDRSVDFLVMSWQDFQKFNASEAYEYYINPSRESISSMDTRWILPSSLFSTHFVWDNQDSFESKTVTALFTVEYVGSFLPRLALLAGLLFFFGGLATTGYGMHPPTKSLAQQTLIIVGYILAASGGIFGLVIGLKLVRKENDEDKFHGKWMTIIALIAIFAFLGLLYLS